MPSSRKTTSRPASTRALKSNTLSENVDVESSSSEMLSTKIKTTKAKKSTKKVLAEQSAPISNIVSSSQAHRKGDIKSTKNKNQSTSSSVQSSPTKKKQLPEDQVEAFLDNYDLETQARLSRLQANLEITIQAAITRMRLAIDRIPRAVRELTLSDFIDEYGADIHAFMGRVPVENMEAGRREWEQIKEERSPVKAKRVKKEQDTQEKRADSTAMSRKAPIVRKTNATRASTAIDASKRTSRTAAVQATRRVTKSSKSVVRGSQLSSPLLPISNLPPPSLSSFNPTLPKEIPQTPSCTQKPRMARPGETIQWQSINGSPIVGVIGNDGIVRPMSFVPEPAKS